MNCARCEGLMVPARFIDLEQTGYLWMSGWRCMNCGHVADAVTEYNRKLQAQGLMAVVTGDHKPKGVAEMAPPVSSLGMSRSRKRKYSAVSMTDHRTQAT